ncbi:FecCD family ABC transporter permease [Oharaeibacter diazotrophicus]|uniref:Iron complex transport system permease protein n=1 Tax=Oharaeibacter diazotrophicus TaxID=1920512 RepID=A0A4R6RGS6_9HYPH|nr:iron ABC transporter permease [Oharaeibacter diazotrophicus]TDP85454.1 iron complex transport system permease protein [Oharaeibacter diazotrophicus]BBE74424.1 hemin transport system permease protein HmuU [Pleomorphomonas sp. SM30]GLS75880.1 iron ABC transporter permease [Oharaeibacter diazotrophicus]
MTSTDALVLDYRRVQARRTTVLAGLAAAVVALAGADLVTGPSAMTVPDALAALLAGPAGEDRLAATILWAIRLPTTAMGALVGAALGLAGLQMQTILANPLASPFTLGFSAAAGFGAALAIMFGSAMPLPGWLAAPVLAFAAVLVAAGLIHAMARLRGADTEVLVLAGIAVMFMFQALQSMLQYLASPEVLQQIVFWLFGSLLKATWTSVAVLGTVLAVALPAVARDAWRLTALSLGDVHARSLGVDVDGLRRRGFVLVALVTAAAVAFVGTIGFVGLVAPHAARALVGEDQRTLIPAAALAGAVTLLAASVLAKLVGGGAVIPIGIVTALVGVPILFTLVLRRARAGAP